MTAETDQAAGQLDEATVLRVLEMIHEMAREADAALRDYNGVGHYRMAQRMSDEHHALTMAGDRLVALYRASLGLEEA